MITDNYSCTDTESMDRADLAVDDAAASVGEKEVTLKYLHLVPIAVARIKRNLPPHISADDLYSMGAQGLMFAAKKFRPETARTFPSFAMMRIRGAILDGLRKSDFCSRRMRRRAREIEAAANTIEQKLGRVATAQEVADALGLSLEEYRRCLEAAQPKMVALDRQPELGDGSGESLHNLLRDESAESGAEQMEKAEISELLAQQIARLPQIPKKILAMYYFENMRFATIAEAFDLSEARVCQIHRATIDSLRKSIKAMREK